MQDLLCHNPNIKWLNVECKGIWGQESVFKNETHSHKWGRMQEIEPNGSQAHSHLESCMHGRVSNIQNLNKKGKQAPNWASKYHWKDFKM
jgi:hypothetical protein